MDNISILQIIERIPELTLKYIGSSPGDKNPQLSKFELTLKYIGSYPADKTSTTEIVFAKLNSVPSNDKGEHWRKFTTLVICWVEKHQNINLILYKKKYRPINPRTLQKTDNLCGFAHFIQHFFFLGSARKT